MCCKCGPFRKSQDNWVQTEEQTRWYLKVKLATVVKGDLKAPFSIATTPRYRWRCDFTLDPYLVMLSVKQEGIKYHFLSLWYDSTWDWTPVSWAIAKYSNHHANWQVMIFTVCQNEFLPSIYWLPQGFWHNE